MKFNIKKENNFIKKLKNILIGTKSELKKKTKNFFGIYESEVIDNQIKSNQMILRYLIIALVLIVGLSLLKNLTEDVPYSFNENGSVQNIERSGENENEQFKLHVSTDEYDKDVEINFYAESNDEKNEQDKTKSFDEMINNIIVEIEENNEKTISLPKKLENGDEIVWQIQSDNTVYIIIGLGIILMLILCKNKDFKINKEKKKGINTIKRDLPPLLNKIILIWKSGKTFEDAVKESIAKLEEGGKKEFFVDNLKDIYKKSKENGDNIIFMINGFAVNTEVKDFIRITNIMVENQYKGSFLLDKLQMEREILWMNRKKSAVEEGKKAETKLVIPMAILLIALIVVTAAPAFIQM